MTAGARKRIADPSTGFHCLEPITPNVKQANVSRGVCNMHKYLLSGLCLGKVLYLRGGTPQINMGLNLRNSYLKDMINHSAEDQGMDHDQTANRVQNKFNTYLYQNKLLRIAKFGGPSVFGMNVETRE